MQIAIRPLLAGDSAGVEAALRIRTDSFAVEVPDFPPQSLVHYVGALAHPWPGSEPHNWLAESDGRPVGLLNVTLPLLDNTENAWIDIHVHPAHQRAGIGRALYAYATEFVRDRGRKRLQAESVDRLLGGPARIGAGTAFLRAMGAHAALPEVRRSWYAENAPDTADLLAEAWSHAEGYSLIQWDGPAPEAYVADLAALEGRLFLDAPMGELTMEPEAVDVARVRAGEEVQRRRGLRRYCTAVRHDATDRIVGFTTIGFDAEQDVHAWQQITIVDPAHRGHRLGLVIKIENLEYARGREPEMRYLHTWNAAENAHMIAINEQVGFRPVDAWYSWQHDL